MFVGLQGFRVLVFRASGPWDPIIRPEFPCWFIEALGVS